MPLIIAGLEAYEDIVGPSAPVFQREMHPLIQLSGQEFKIFGLVTSIFSQQFSEMRAFLKTLSPMTDLASIPPLPAPPRQQREWWSRSSSRENWDVAPRDARQPQQQQLLQQQQNGAGYHVEGDRASPYREERHLDRDDRDRQGRDSERDDRYYDREDGRDRYQHRDRKRGRDEYERDRERYREEWAYAQDDGRERDREGYREGSWRNDWFGGHSEEQQQQQQHSHYKRYSDDDDERDGGPRKKGKYKGKVNKNRNRGGLNNPNDNQQNRKKGKKKNKGKGGKKNKGGNQPSQKKKRTA